MSSNGISIECLMNSVGSGMLQDDGSVALLRFGDKLLVSPNIGVL